MASTIHDVAKLAGVNPSTVSRVLNGKAHVMQETEEKINAAMRELDFHPNSRARSLANGSSGAIGVVVDAEDADAFSNVFFSRSLFAIERVAQVNQYNVILLNGARHAGGAGSIEKLILEKKVDGLVLPPSTIHPDLVRKIESFPCVVLGQPDTEYGALSWVDVNNVQGAELAARHLTEKGYRCPAFLGGSEKNGFTRRRIRGFRTAAEGEDVRIISTDGSAEDAHRAALAVLRETDRPDSFVCNDNMTAFGLLTAAKELGIRVPEQLGIVTFDNYPIAEYTDPQLTSVDVDTAMLGEQTAKLLFQQIRNKLPCQQLLLGTTLIERNSSQKV